MEFAPSLSIRRLSPSGRHFFSGYYDTPLVDAGSSRLLVHETAFCEREPGPEDAATLGWLDQRSDTQEFHPLASTTAWNFQQGAFLQWVGPETERVFWNQIEPGKPLQSCSLDLRSGERRNYDRAVANLSRDGRHGLSLSFARLYDFRPGYGYAGQQDPNAETPAPEDDGIFLLDLESGASRLILSLADLARHVAEVVSGPIGKVTANHLTFSPSGERFLGLARAPIQASKGHRWGTFAFVANRDGKDLFPILPFGMISHYYWENDERLLVWSEGPDGKQLYRVTLCPGRDSRLETVDPGFFLRDGHMSLSPDGKWLLYDSYPDENREQSLFLYRMDERRGFCLGKFAVAPFATGQIRCDLHPRWNPDGRGFTFDSTHEGYRAVYACDLLGLS